MLHTFTTHYYILYSLILNLIFNILFTSPNYDHQCRPFSGRSNLYVALLIWSAIKHEGRAIVVSCYSTVIYSML